MKERLVIIHLEDDPTDAELIEAMLESEGMACEIRRVETESDFLSAITTTHADLILSDYALPTFDGLSALILARTHCLDVPFIFVTGAMGEEKAVESMKQGATDYVLKHNLARLGMVVRRALREAEDRQERQRAEGALRESEKSYRELFETSLDGIVFTDLQGRYVECNQAYLDLLGYETIDELRHRSYKDLTPPEYHAFEEKIIVEQTLIRGYCDEYEKEYFCKNGERVSVTLRAWLRRDSNNTSTGMWVLVHDITERKKAELRLKTALDEKEALLREIYHRTKNNMQVIRSMLSLRAAARQNAEVHAFVREIEQRILTMALVHQKLYESNDLSQIQLHEYLEDLISSLMQNYEEIARKVVLNLHLDRQIMVLIDTAIPCGLVVTEMLSNALQYAFPEGCSGEIQIKVSRTPQGLIELYFADNGVGVPPGFDVRAQKSLGLRTIIGIVEHQLRGEISCDLRDGVAYTVQFRDNLHALRV